jgi:hypothetical protein
VERPQPTGSHERIAQGGLIDHELRYSELIHRAPAPPIPRQSLMSGQYDVATSSRGQVAHDCGLDVDGGHVPDDLTSQDRLKLSSRTG